MCLMTYLYSTTYNNVKAYRKSQSHIEVNKLGDTLNDIKDIAKYLENSPAVNTKNTIR